MWGVYTNHPVIINVIRVTVVKHSKNKTKKEKRATNSDWEVRNNLTEDMTLTGS